ncbi:hypothetical protein [Actinacidiphila acididurans]|uniref:PH domain-containing protein n=1 Tax=Actinacidiphila acididurans TaxID=2784346 RepID=A0ABS2U4Z7_9ACTN|nr:hypothetical protein [Actinacidiphila acididurans]MBM9509213.1 hypothetical protein [Actinacidiphila acididurans]
MRTRPTTAAEVDAWLAVLRRHGHLHHVEAGPGTSWVVQRRRYDGPWTLHHPVLAMDWIEELLREIRTYDVGSGR